jgi:hypothetical protein
MTHARPGPPDRSDVGGVAIARVGDRSAHGGRRARSPSVASAAAPSSGATARPLRDTRRGSTGPAGGQAQTTGRSLSAGTVAVAAHAAVVALAFGEELSDRGMGSREGLASRRVKSRRRAFTSPSRRLHASRAPRLPASPPTLREPLPPGPVQPARASRRAWTGPAPPKRTSFKPPPTLRPGLHPVPRGCRAEPPFR